MALEIPSAPDIRRIELSVERMFQRSGRTEFPTVGRVAKALGYRVGQVIEAVEDSENLQTTYYNVPHYNKVPDGSRFIETLAPPS